MMSKWNESHLKQSTHVDNDMKGILKNGKRYSWLENTENYRTF